MIEVMNLCKSFGGRPAVKGVTFSVGKGEILGFLGPNGAGKTTTMRIITCYLPPDSGGVKVGGYDVFEQSMEVRRRIGYLPENPPLYGEMVVRSYLDFVAKIRGVPGSQRRSRVDAAIERCGLGSVAGRLIANLSKGYRQRVGLAQAILHDPQVLILDEPTIGLDPEQIIEIRDLIRHLGGDHTVVLSTHILPEVAKTCTRVAIISYGEIVQEGALAQLDSGAQADKIRIRVARGGDEVLAALRARPGVLGAAATGEPGVCMIEVEKGESVREEIAAAAVRGGWGLLEMTPITRTLEEIYLEATRRIPPAEAAASVAGPPPQAVEPAVAASAEGGAA